jgi:hypothetical protein
MQGKGKHNQTNPNSPLKTIHSSAAASAARQ